MKDGQPELEPDKESECPHPAEAPGVFGHDGARAAFMQALKSGRLHSAWLLSGEKGIGKATLAYDLARQVLGKDMSAPEKSISDDLVRRRAHSRLFRIARPWNPEDKAPKVSTPIESVRALKSRLNNRAAVGEWRVIIIDSLDDLTGNAANALLKLLEEPPARCLFFLISHQPGKVLPTIRSRARPTPLRPLTPEDLGAWAAAQPSETFAQSLLAAAEGVPLACYRLASSGTEIQAEISNILERLRREPGGGYGPELQNFADKFTGKANHEKSQKLWYFLEQTLRREMRRQIEAAAPLPAIATFPDLWYEWRQVKEQADVYNLDQKQVMMTALSQLAALMRGARA